MRVRLGSMKKSRSLTISLINPLLVLDLLQLKKVVIMATVVFCHQCKEKVSIDTVRYAPNGKDLVCMTCISRAPKQKEQKEVQRTRFQCTTCNYKFSIRRDSRIEKKCPYCASKKIAARDDVTSHSVLDDVTSQPDYAFLR